MKRFTFSLPFSAMLFLLSSPSLWAQISTAPQIESSFTLKMDNSTWKESFMLAETNVSKQEIGGCNWDEWAFQRSANDDFFTTGNAQQSLHSRIRSLGPVSEAIYNVVVYLGYNKRQDFLLQSVVLTRAKDADFETTLPPLTQKLSDYIGDNLPTIVRFEIEDPEPDCFYKIEINVNAGVNNWIELHRIAFNEHEVLYQPTLTQGNNTSGNFFTVQTTSGELHLLASHFTVEDGEYVCKGNLYPADTTSEAAGVSEIIPATETEDDKWQNPVPAVNPKSFTIYPHVNSNIYTKIRAKSMSGGTQSPELVAWVHNEGITTSIEDLRPGNFESPTEEWFTLSGMRVENPSGGIFICLRNGKAFKVRL